MANAAAMQPSSAVASAVCAKTDRVGRVAVVGEIVEKEFVPAPGGVPTPVDEQNRRRIDGLEGSFEMISSFGLRAAGAAEVLRGANIDASMADLDACIADFR
jgi:hypothetical protein